MVKFVNVVTFTWPLGRVTLNLPIAGEIFVIMFTVLADRQCLNLREGAHNRKTAIGLIIKTYGEEISSVF